MKMKDLFDVQRKLDERIVHEKSLEGQDLLPKRILALQVELGELAQNWRGFKFWSDDREPRTVAERGACKYCAGTGSIIPGAEGVPDCWACNGEGEEIYNPLLEEYVDCLHFILSIGLEIEADWDFETVTFDDIWNENTRYLDERMRLEEIFIELIVDAKWKTESSGYWWDYLEHFTSLGERLGLTKDEVLEAYTTKNEVNHKRQTGGY